jgi:hypothetical protein
MWRKKFWNISKKRFSFDPFQIEEASVWSAAGPTFKMSPNMLSFFFQITFFIPEAEFDGTFAAVI